MASGRSSSVARRRAVAYTVNSSPAAASRRSAASSASARPSPEEQPVIYVGRVAASGAAEVRAQCPEPRPAPSGSTCALPAALSAQLQLSTTLTRITCGGMGKVASESSGKEQLGDLSNVVSILFSHQKPITLLCFDMTAGVLRDPVAGRSRNNDAARCNRPFLRTIVTTACIYSCMRQSRNADIVQCLLSNRFH